LEEKNLLETLKKDLKALMEIITPVHEKLEKLRVKYEG